VRITHCTAGTVRHIIHTAVQELSEAHISEPLLSVVHLLATALHLPWDTGYRDLMDLVYRDDASVATRQGSSVEQRLPSRLLTTEEERTFRSLLDRRLQHEPIQYLCGQWDFLDFTLAVRAPLLCPRPETEELVLLALEDVKEKRKNEPIRILDVGCGTGCIGIALAHKMPHVVVTAIDVEQVAVATSSENAARIGILSRYEARMCAIEGFVLTKDDEPYDMVISNPPYIPPDDMTGLQPDVLQYESHQALAGGGSDGMNVIRTIVQKLPLVCKAGAICWMEVDPSQPAILRDWLSQESRGSVQFLCSKTDMFGKERFAKLLVL
jgi:release factor glutamine methyltransferase